MARFYGPVGYATTVETSPGVFTETIQERFYYGDELRSTRRLRESEYLNGTLSVTNSLSILADAFALENFFAIRYVKWAGAFWKVSEVEIQRPRLILRLGGVYNGLTAGPP